MNVAALIGIMIGIVVGVNLISPVNSAVATITTPTYSASVVSLAGVLTIIFVTVIILGAVAWIEMKPVPLDSNIYRIIRQTRGSLNSLLYGNHELNYRLNVVNAQRLDGGDPKKDHGIVRTLLKDKTNWGFKD